MRRLRRRTSDPCVARFTMTALFVPERNPPPRPISTLDFGHSAGASNVGVGRPAYVRVGSPVIHTGRDAPDARVPRRATPHDAQQQAAAG
jgi:hypothetical protein